MRIGPDTSFLLIVDVQEKLVPAVVRPDRVVANAARLMTGAARLEVPTLLTAHYPNGIGPVVAELRELAPPDGVLEKIHFDAVSEPACAERFAALDRPHSQVSLPKIPSVGVLSSTVGSGPVMIRGAHGRISEEIGQ